MKLTDVSLMTFGKHKGMKLGDIPASYLLWILDQEWARREHPQLIGYIRENKNALEYDAQEERERDGLSQDDVLDD